MRPRPTLQIGVEVKARRPPRDTPGIGPIVEGIGPPLSRVPWSAEFVAQSLEILPVTRRDDDLLWLKPVHAPSLRVGLSPSNQPSQFVLDVLAWYPLTPLVVHSTSWRHEDGRIVLTYVAVVEAPSALPPGSLDIVAIQRSDLARGSSMSPPRSIGVEEVLEHAIRHLAWLAREDPAIAGALPSWGPVLRRYDPEPFRALG